MLLAVIGLVVAAWALVETVCRRSLRWPRFGRTMQQVRHRFAAAARLAPGTCIYLSVVLVSTTEQSQLSARLARAMARQSSTNVVLLTSRPLDVLTTSAFWLDNPGIGAVFLLVQFAVIIALLEASIGTGRWLISLIVGHVGASLLVGFGLWFGIRHGWVDARLARATDVGISYGLAAATVLLVLGLRGRARLLLLAVVVVRVGAGLAFTPSFTDVGHLLAGLSGAGLYVLFGRPHLRPFHVIGWPGSFGFEERADHG